MLATGAGCSGGATLRTAPEHPAPAPPQFRQNPERLELRMILAHLRIDDLDLTKTVTGEELDAKLQALRESGAVERTDRRWNKIQVRAGRGDVDWVRSVVDGGRVIAVECRPRQSYRSNDDWRTHARDLGLMPGELYGFIECDPAFRVGEDRFAVVSHGIQRIIIVVDTKRYQRIEPADSFRARIESEFAAGDLANPAAHVSALQHSEDPQLTALGERIRADMRAKAERRIKAGEPKFAAWKARFARASFAESLQQLAELRRLVSEVRTRDSRSRELTDRWEKHAVETMAARARAAAAASEPGVRQQLLQDVGRKRGSSNLFRGYLEALATAEEVDTNVDSIVSLLGERSRISDASPRPEWWHTFDHAARSRLAQLVAAEPHATDLKAKVLEQLGEVLGDRELGDIAWAPRMSAAIAFESALANAPLAAIDRWRGAAESGADDAELDKSAQSSAAPFFQLELLAGEPDPLDVLSRMNSARRDYPVVHARTAAAADTAIRKGLSERAARAEFRGHIGTATGFRMSSLAGVFFANVPVDRTKPMRLNGTTDVELLRSSPTDPISRLRRSLIEIALRSLPNPGFIDKARLTQFLQCERVLLWPVCWRLGVLFDKDADRADLAAAVGIEQSHSVARVGRQWNWFAVPPEHAAKPDLVMAEMRKPTPPELRAELQAIEADRTRLEHSRPPRGLALPTQEEFNSRFEALNARLESKEIDRPTFDSEWAAIEQEIEKTNARAKARRAARAAFNQQVDQLTQRARRALDERQRITQAAPFRQFNERYLPALQRFVGQRLEQHVAGLDGSDAERQNELAWLRWWLGQSSEAPIAVDWNVAQAAEVSAARLRRSAIETLRAASCTEMSRAIDQFWRMSTAAKISDHRAAVETLIKEFKTRFPIGYGTWSDEFRGAFLTDQLSDGSAGK